MPQRTHAYAEHHLFLFPPVTRQVSWNKERAKLGKLVRNMSNIKLNLWAVGIGDRPSNTPNDTTVMASKIAKAA